MFKSLNKKQILEEDKTSKYLLLRLRTNNDFDILLHRLVCNFPPGLNKTLGPDENKLTEAISGVKETDRSAIATNVKKPVGSIEVRSFPL